MAVTPTCTEISVRVNMGVTYQLVKYELSSRFDTSETRTYAIPEGMSESEIDDFRDEKFGDIQSALNKKVQEEFDSLVEQKKALQ